MSTVTAPGTLSFRRPRTFRWASVTSCSAARASANTGAMRSAKPRPASVVATFLVVRVSNGTPSRASSRATVSLT